MRYATAETVTFSPIPCWAHLSPELYRARIAELVESIEAEAARVTPWRHVPTLTPERGIPLLPEANYRSNGPLQAVPLCLLRASTSARITPPLGAEPRPRPMRSSSYQMISTLIQGNLHQERSALSSEDSRLPNNANVGLVYI
jgi:hypothetical protein